MDPRYGVHDKLTIVGTGSYVIQDTIDLRDATTIVLVPKVTNANNADLEIEVTYKHFTGDVADVATADWHRRSEQLALTQPASQDIDLNGDATSILPRLEGVKGLRYSVKNSGASATNIDMYIESSAV